MAAVRGAGSRRRRRQPLGTRERCFAFRPSSTTAESLWPSRCHRVQKTGSRAHAIPGGPAASGWHGRDSPWRNGDRCWPKASEPGRSKSLAISVASTSWQPRGRKQPTPGPPHQDSRHNGEMTAAPSLSASNASGANPVPCVERTLRRRRHSRTNASQPPQRTVTAKRFGQTARSSRSSPVPGRVSVASGLRRPACKVQRRSWGLGPLFE